MIKKNSKIFIAGHNGMVGSAILKKLTTKGYKKLYFKSRKSLDLTNQIKVNNILKKFDLMQFFQLQLKLGGIQANNLKKVYLLQLKII